MRTSSSTARLLTIVVALVLTPIALILLSVGGQTMNLTLLAYGFDGDVTPLIGPVLLQALGLALLVLVALTGIRSSAGLIVVGLSSIGPLVVAVLPVTLSWLYRVTPREWGDGLLYGVPLIVLASLGAMGLVLALVRRDPRPKSGVLWAIGLIASPLLLVAGAGAIAWGIADGTLFALQRFQFDIRPEAAGAVVAGTVLVVAGVLLTRWSPFALILPAVALLAVGVALIAAPDATVPMLFQLPRPLNTVVPSMLLYAGGAVGVLYLAFTAVLLRVRAQWRRSEQAPSAPATYPPSATTPATYPPA